MSIRYEDTDGSVADLLHGIRTLHFSALKNAKIAVLFDLKKRKAGGLITLAKIMSPNDLIRHYTKAEADDYEGFDYIIVLDKVCWDNIEEVDRTRTLRHELRHAYFDIDSEDHPYKIADHDVTDFYTEMELNADDPRWRVRLASLADGIYEQQKEDKADNTRGPGRGRKKQFNADAPHKNQGDMFKDKV